MGLELAPLSAPVTSQSVVLLESTGRPVPAQGSAGAGGEELGHRQGEVAGAVSIVKRVTVGRQALRS